MAEEELSYVKTIVRSVLTSSKNDITISQLLNDYYDLEGENIPFQKLGFNTIYELLAIMNDILKVPPFPSMNSVVKLILDEKTVHLRKLIMNQKCKKVHPKKRYSNSNSHSQYKNNYGNFYEKITKFQNNLKNNKNNLMGYDYIYKKSLNLPKGFVTKELRRYIENLCSDSQRTSISSFKQCLIKHPDYKILRTSTVNNALNMLKYFIIFSNGHVYLKNSPHEIFSQTGSKNDKELNTNHTNILNDSNALDEDNEYSNFDFDDDETPVINLNNKITNKSDLNSFQSNSNDLVKVHEGIKNVLNVSDTSVYEPTNQKSNSKDTFIVQEGIKTVFNGSDTSFDKSINQKPNSNDSSIVQKEIENVLNVSDTSIDKSVNQSSDSCNPFIVQKEIKNVFNGSDTSFDKSANLKSNSNDTFIIQEGIKNVFNGSDTSVDKSLTQKPNSNDSSIVQKGIENVLNVSDTSIDKSVNQSPNSNDSSIVQKGIENVLNVSDTSIDKSVNQSSDSCNPFIVQKEIKNVFNGSDTSVDKSMTQKFKSKIEIEKEKVKTEKTENNNVDYQKMIVSIIQEFPEPLTVKQILKIFKNKYGYDFTSRNAYRSCMDYFRLFPNFFDLENQYSTNSIVKLVNKEELFQHDLSVRQHFLRASIFDNGDSNDTKSIEPVPQKCASDLEVIQHHKKSSMIDKSAKCGKYDSDSVSDPTKNKMRLVLSKYPNGIPCNMFMDIYEKQFGSGFVYFEYGFRSMLDMAYQLPSVFYVKDDVESNVIFYHAKRKTEFEETLNNASQLYKNIPKTVLYNLSTIFKKYSSGIRLESLKYFYGTMFGQLYEPLAYGYSSEKQMFESLNKMVEIRNNKLYTIDPFAYIQCTEIEENLKNNKTKNIPALPIHNFMLHYSGNDVCNARFEFPKIHLENRKTTKVMAAEIFTPSSFYVHLSSECSNLSEKMNELQKFYWFNEEKYQILPDLIIVGLPCTSQFENSKLWHRAKVVDIIDDMHVRVLYVDFGSVEVVKKSDVRFLATKFGSFPIQALHCSLFETEKPNYTLEMNENFAISIDNNRFLEATFKKTMTLHGVEKHILELFIKTKGQQKHLNKIVSDQLEQAHLHRNTESVRRTIAMVRDQKTFKNCNKKNVIDKFV